MSGPEIDPQLIVKIYFSTPYFGDMEFCPYCHKKISRNSRTKDHAIAKSLGGEKFANNIVHACNRCNNKKSVSEGLLKEFLLALQDRKYHPGSSRIHLLDKGIKFYANIWKNFSTRYNVLLPFDQYSKLLTDQERHLFLSTIHSHGIYTREEYEYDLFLYQKQSL